MEALEKLEREKAQILTRISEAALRGEAEDVLRESVRLEQVESLIHRYTGLVQEIDNLSHAEEAKNTALPDRAVIGTYEITSRKSIPKNGKEHGRAIRDSFIRKLLDSGINLQPVKGVIYKTSSGSRLGIAFATERQPDRWFLGLTKGAFDHAVLLCHSETLGTQDICLPRDFFAKYGDRMSASNGQIKFNVVRKGRTFSILVPGTGGVSTSEFLGKYSLLR